MDPCFMCQEMMEEMGVGTGPFNYQSPNDAHPGVTCEQVEEMEW